MNALAKNPAKPVVLIGGADLCFLCPPVFEIDLAAGHPGVALPHGAGRRRSNGRGCAGRSAGSSGRTAASAPRTARWAAGCGWPSTRPGCSRSCPPPCSGRWRSGSGARLASARRGLGDRDRDRLGHGDEDARARVRGCGRSSRRFGGTTAVRVRPSGRAEGGDAGVVVVVDRRSPPCSRSSPPARRAAPPSGARPATTAVTGSPVSAGSAMLTVVALVEVDVDLVAGRDLGEVAHLGPGGDDEGRAVGVVAQPHLAGGLVDRLDRRAGVVSVSWVPPCRARRPSPSRP